VVVRDPSEPVVVDLQDDQLLAFARMSGDIVSQLVNLFEELLDDHQGLVLQAQTQKNVIGGQTEERPPIHALLREIQAQEFERHLNVAFLQITDGAQFLREDPKFPW
jgi:hypothetical protein